ncbi:tyrosine-type recombinase/integrase [Haloarcula salinisoli]|uniref:Tyrosine-type recombinase/integrase n=1 Tax=Haloarcula salinisoli TaxID=2487746 RepID=A0A8J7YGR4_9EURY|nr:tyrosine-type recombinase/integrase [Halomicroarcula salinisoli]MBX0288537.1 tyrosine-type recombinase/integrase [Halomicroarcula salinisoli]MBX0305645.1 tyrosine-type recombinase/integrase [Halomicroarcula salinisoli]
MPKSPDSDSLTNQDEPSWTLLDRDGLVDAYWDVVAPAMRADGLDPETEQPTYEWLNENGFRRFIYTLQEHHDTTVTEFCKQDLELESQGYDWEIDHADTVEALERYLDRQQQRKSWSESTIDAHRSRLGRYVRAYADVNDADDLLSPVARESAIPAHEAVDACWATFDELDQEVARETLRRIYITVSDWYTTLVSRREAALNPTDGLDYNWSGDDAGTTSNPPLGPDHVAALFEAAEDTREKLLVVALCGWGLRSGEVAALHADQLVLEDDAPRIEFESRKNGPGSVALIYGQDVVETRTAQFSDNEDWSGYLFPSPRSSSGHRTGGTIRNWFDELAERAALPAMIDGRRPVPQMARRFWYDRYSSTVEELVEHQIQEVAEEQGSASASVVWEDYLSEDRRRELRREFMREKLALAFESEPN